MASMTFLDETQLLPDIPATPSAEEVCEIVGCDEILVYGGRGRRPKRCPEHKRAPVGTPIRTAPTKSARNDSAARSAAAALGQMNALLALVAMVAPAPFSFPRTAAALGNANEGFEEQAYAALLTDPKLCQWILKAGSTSGKVSLLIAYGMLTAAVAPVAIAEYKDNTAKGVNAE
jgi:hypothetical protein